MLAYPREMLRRNLSPDAFNKLLYFWWKGKFYGPRLLASSLRRATPTVYRWPRDVPSSLQRLETVNVLAPTVLCRVMTWYGSDKGSGFHNYTAIYSALFTGLREQPLRIFELGLGTSNPDIRCNMGANGRPGASLRAWRAFFPRALVYGADIDRDILFAEDRIKTFHCDQCDADSIRRVWAEADREGLGMDIIIDDGLHRFKANRSFLDGSLERLRAGGFYVLEDIHRPALARWVNAIETAYSPRFPTYEFALLDLPNPQNPNRNSLLVVHRPGITLRS
jgi:SAM-dependent methyltransferase